MSIRDWALLVTAAGIDVRPLDPMDCFLLAGKIINDEPLRQAVLTTNPGTAWPMGIRASVLRSWPESERVKLRERILGVIQMERRTGNT